jgi:hypothetical protein
LRNGVTVEVDSAGIDRRHFSAKYTYRPTIAQAAFGATEKSWFPFVCSSDMMFVEGRLYSVRSCKTKIASVGFVAGIGAWIASYPCIHCVPIIGTLLLRLMA